MDLKWTLGEKKGKSVKNGDSLNTFSHQGCIAFFQFFKIRGKMITSLQLEKSVKLFQSSLQI
jgi:hypothetical protein